MSLGNKIKKTRTEKGLTQKELAIQSMIPQKNLSTYENDLVMPAADTLKKIAEALSVTTDYLLGGSKIIELNNPDYVALLNEVDQLPEKEKDAILTTLRTFLSAYQKGKKK